MRYLSTKSLILILIVTTVALCGANDPAPLPTHSGTGVFLMLSDIHFDPYADPAILRQLGAEPLPPCQAAASTAFAKFGRDTNYPLLKSALDEAAAAAQQYHLHYDYVIVTGDLLAHNFDTRYQQCVGKAEGAYRKFASATVRFVDGMIAQALPGVPVFATLGNNDSDKGDYAAPSGLFLQTVGQDWSRSWGSVPAAVRDAALRTFGRAGNYELPHPTVANDEIVVLNTNLWAARNSGACSESDPDPAGQFQWLADTLGEARRTGRTATLVMHVLPGIDGMMSSAGLPKPFWSELCTRKLIATLTDYRGVVREMYAGHIHRDDFRLFPDVDGKPLCTIHIVPAISPIYLDNPAIEMGWYDQRDGSLRDFATFALDLGNAHPTWSLEYVFTQAYGRARPDVANMAALSRELRNPQSEASKNYANYYGAGVNIFLTPDNWSNYACAQTEITAADFARCRVDGTAR